MKENERTDDIGIAAIFCWVSARHWVKKKAVRAGTGHERLKDIVYSPYLDLEEQYYIGDTANACTAIITVTEALLHSWGITKEELKEQVAGNMAAEGYSMVALDKILSMEPLPESDRLYVVTNSKGYFGAAIITEPELLEQFAGELGGDFYILPSSVHELILIPACTEYPAEWLRRIVRDVNRMELSENDFLSDNIYYFRAAEKRVEIIPERNQKSAV